MSTITRRAALGAIASIPAMGGATASFANPPAATPDERITAALEEIKMALWEKWPNAPLRIVDCDDIHEGMILILTHISHVQPGTVDYRRNGRAREAVRS